MKNIYSFVKHLGRFFVRLFEEKKLFHVPYAWDHKLMIIDDVFHGYDIKVKLGFKLRIKAPGHYWDFASFIAKFILHGFLETHNKSSVGAKYWGINLWQTILNEVFL